MQTVFVFFVRVKNGQRIYDMTLNASTQYGMHCLLSLSGLEMIIIYIFK